MGILKDLFAVGRPPPPKRELNKQAQVFDTIGQPLLFDGVEYFLEQDEYLLVGYYIDNTTLVYQFRLTTRPP
jgi:hypothetical protein